MAESKTHDLNLTRKELTILIGSLNNTLIGLTRSPAVHLLEPDLLSQMRVLGRKLQIVYEQSEKES